MRKKSAKQAADWFMDQVNEIEEFVTDGTVASLSSNHLTWVHDYGVIRPYRAFENLILNCLVAAINNNTEQLSQTTGVSFPKHLTDEVCEYLIVGNGYFDFKGRDGLIQTLRRYLPKDHYLIEVVKKSTYKEELEKLAALRNFAAHDSPVSKKAALNAIGASNLSSAGAWLKRQDRFQAITAALKKLATEVHQRSPY